MVKVFSVAGSFFLDRTPLRNVIVNRVNPTAINLMKKTPLIRFFSFFVCVGAAVSAHAGMTNTLSASLAAPIGSSTNRGFTVRVAQAWSTNGPVGNSYTRAYKQINGTLLDTNNLVVQNAAFAGTNSGGSWNYDTINFERQASVMD